VFRHCQGLAGHYRTLEGRGILAATEGFDRRDSWWAAEQKLAPMPQILRNIWLPFVGEQESAQALITNQVDFGGRCNRRRSPR